MRVQEHPALHATASRAWRLKELAAAPWGWRVLLASGVVCPQSGGVLYLTLIDTSGDGLRS